MRKFNVHIRKWYGDAFVFRCEAEDANHALALTVKTHPRDIVVGVIQ